MIPRLPFTLPLAVAAMTTYVCAVLRHFDNRRHPENAGTPQLALRAVFVWTLVISCLLYWIVPSLVLPPQNP